MSSLRLDTDRLSVADAGKVRIELQEWLPKDYLLTQAQVLELLRLPGKLVDAQPLPTGETRLKARSIVGRLSTENLDLVIRPKCPVPSLLLMLSEVYELSQLVPQLVGYESSPEIVDLLVQVFLKQVDYITRLGLKRDYVSRQEDLLSVRGRVNVRRSLALHLRGQPRVDCSYEEFTLDVPANQLLVTALRAISGSKALPCMRRRLAHMFSAEFPGVREISVNSEGLSSIACDRLNLHYEPALKMAHLILRGMGIEHEFGSTDVSGFTLDMNQLFEKFIARKLQRFFAGEDVVVGLQQSFAFDKQEQAVIKPDIVFQSLRGHRVVADTKYKLDDAPAPSDLYQMLAYCRVLKVSYGILITAAASGTHSYTVKDGATTIKIVPINLDRSLAEIDESLKKLASQIRDLLLGKLSVQVQNAS